MDSSERNIDPPIFRLRAVSFEYAADRPVLKNADFDLRRGERLALVGPNGSGKTTLFHLMMGLIHPQTGTIEAFGAPRLRESDFVEVRARVGLLFQDSDDQLFSPTVLEDVAFGPLNFGRTPREARAIAERTLSLLGLHGFANRVTHKLSGGQRRLVALATVLAMEPEALLLDEPSSGLDAKTVDCLVAILGKLPQAVIVISHDESFLRRTTTRRCRLEDGKILED